jgi:hypothetical protein
MRDHGAHNFALSESNRSIAGTLDFGGCCFISFSTILPGAYKKISQIFYRWQLDGFRRQIENKEMLILINHIFLPFLRSLLSAFVIRRNV